MIEMDIGKSHLNPFGGLHGGAYASAIDTAAYWALYCEMEENVGWTSLDLRVDFLAPATGGKIEVKGRRIKLGKTICLAEATAFDPEERVLAHGLSKMMVLKGAQTIREAVHFLGSAPLPPKFV